MAKTITNAKTTTANARSKLAAGVHWREVSKGVHLGYRVAAGKGGTWLVRFYKGAGKYSQSAIGAADDNGVKADGINVFDYDQAAKKAVEIVNAANASAKAEADGPLITVATAVEAYCVRRDETTRALKGRHVASSDARTRLTRDVLNNQKLAATPFHSLTDDDLKSWQTGLPATMKATTIKRLRNDFRAALNETAKAHRKRLPADIFTTIKSGMELVNSTVASVSNGDGRDGQILPVETIRKIVAAAKEIDADFHRLIVVMAATGARFSQVTRMTVADVDTASHTLMVPEARKGRGGLGKIGRTARPVAPAVIEVLQPILDRPRSTVLLERDKYERVKGLDWRKCGRQPWHMASDLQAQWADVRERVGLEPHVVPYALRHSSITHQIQHHLPAMLVAKLHDTSVSMIEKNYAQYIVDAATEITRRAVMPIE
ncbi:MULTISPECIES: tyrosine-type recombinase/integrase [unclassified Mesorhizobium]|uniref:tyrosine-type recombinase/integrase n=1 Tax=unclassified Mesorhizobium TaxID=325217 RepID=UPI0030144C29